MESEHYEIAKVYTIAGTDILSEIVKDEDTPTFRAFHLRTSCESHRWGKRTVGFGLTCCKNPGSGDVLTILEENRRKQAERIVKVESGEIAEANPILFGIQVQGPSGTTINVIAQPDLSVSPTLLSKELIAFLGLPPLARASFQEQIVSPQLFTGVVRSGPLAVETMITPSEHGSPACILGGHFFQKALQGKEALISELVLPDDRRALANAARCKKKYVLILGKYGDQRPRLEKFRRALSSLGFVGMILDEYPDIEEQSLTEKMVTYASICRFVVVDDLVPSGHISELEICAQRRFVTAILRLQGKASNAMQADMSDDLPLMGEFSYEGDVELEAKVAEAAKWADTTVTERAMKLNRRYGAWRGPNKMM
jgi:hypothetical protein